jgi:hypothetical protein
MSVIYDMASGKTRLPPAENNTAAVCDELIPALDMRELPSGRIDVQPAAYSIHLVRALLRKG